MQKANAGDASAQHELGLRYLFGKGFPADTIKAAYWIKKSADQGFTTAQFNFGILLMNGRGVDWNPFLAYKYFQASANKDNPDALYVMGLFYTENFVVQRDWQKAYQFFKKSSNLGYEQAALAMKDIEQRGLISEKPESEKKRKDKSKKSSNKNASINFLFLDFSSDTADTINDTVLIKDVYRGIDTADNIIYKNKSVASIDSSDKSILFTAAEVGSPEAICFIGRCYEKGIYFSKNLILAGLYYIKALNLDSYRAPILLSELVNNQEFINELEIQVSKKNLDALYIWAGLTYAGYNRVLNEKQAFELLQETANRGHIPSIIELGSCYFTGKSVQQDRSKAIELWEIASKQGNVEATLRISAAKILGQKHSQELNNEVMVLKKASKQGSLLADLTLAYCYEKGIVVNQDKGEAYRLYHKSMFRGSIAAFNSLRRMHDEIRPTDDEFKIVE